MDDDPRSLMPEYRAAKAHMLNGTQFTGGPRVHPRPNSQGTLFQGGKPTDVHRWPRGYSPDRMVRVRAALAGKVSIAHSPDSDETLAEQNRSNPHYNPASMEHTKRLMLEPLARSSHQISDMQSLGGLRLSMQPHEDVGEMGHYSPGPRNIQMNPIREDNFLGMDPHFKQSFTDSVLLHEMGHHVDITHNSQDYEKRIRSAGGIDNGIRGEQETKADASMVQHFRNDPRNARTKYGVKDAEHMTYGQRGVAGLITGGGYTDPSPVLDRRLGMRDRHLQSKQFEQLKLGD